MENQGHCDSCERGDDFVQLAIFNYFNLEAQDIMAELLEKHASDGELQFVGKHLLEMLKIPPISQRGNMNEIIGQFGDFTGTKQ